jgi:putative oxidoreductase
MHTSDSTTLRASLRQFERRIESRLSAWLARFSIVFLRVSLGLVFLGFGALKFFPGISPAEDLAKRTTEALTFNLIPGSVGIIGVAAIETAIGLSLTTGRYRRLGLGLLGLAMVGVFSPLVLFSGDLFARPYEQTLAGQYVLKDIVLLAAALVVAVSGPGGRIEPGGDRRHHPAIGQSELRPALVPTRATPRAELVRVRATDSR